MKKRILYILSTSYAGSHFLSLMLGSNSQAMHIGEVKRLRKARDGSESSVCYVCGDEGLCPVLSGINQENINDIYENIFSKVDPGITTLVDASKKPFWAERFINDDKYEYKFIHLIRDPRAYIRRMTLRYKELGRRLRVRRQVAVECPKLALYFLFRSDSILYAYRWLQQNQEISDFLARNRLKASLVTYRDLAMDTANQLQRLTEEAGLIFEPAQLEYWKAVHHGTQKIEYQANKSEKIFDLRWREFLSPELSSKIVADRNINKYLTSIGLKIAENGLTEL
jgi:hypothetical protein